jgi:hypothetical protein
MIGTVRHLSLAAVVSLITAAALSAQQATAAPVRDSAKAYIVGKEETVPVVVSFGRPAGSGRSIVADHAASHLPWSPGNGDPTTITCTSAFMVGDLKLAPGSYSLWALPDASGVTLIVNRRTGPAATTYDPSADAGRAALAVEAVDPPIEPLSISLRAVRKGPDTLISQYDQKVSQASNKEHYTIGLRTGNVQLLVITWDHFRWSLPVKLQD